MRRIKHWVVVSLVGVLVSASVVAEDRVETAWSRFTDELEQVGQRMQARLPERLRDDPQVQREADSLILQAMAREVLEVLAADEEHPVFLPSLGAAINIFQPNADTVYLNANISDQGTYRLRGDSGSVRIIKMAQFRSLTNEVAFEDGPSSLQALAYNDFNELTIDGQGRFDVLLSRQRPDDHKGDWWELRPGTGFLMIRQMSSNWASERDWRVAIERLDTPVQRVRVSAAELQARLDILALRIGNVALSLVTHVDNMRNAGYLNRLRIMHTPGSLEGQFYYEGAYEITADEALVVEAKVPDECLYWSTILTNDIYQTIDWINNQSSLNDTQARVDVDGVVRFVLSLKDPGIHNWLDPAGHASGALQGRWTGCAGTPIPEVTKVKFADLDSFLPADTARVTAEEREAAIRERRMHFQLRPLW
ncbi:hypothetical protein Q6D67_20090 [Haliea sp. E1-2-M8]|uniref:hypothetical protein n=1 Tax=Haliea sp. E1-2-M8 TaxID=3064706 RepID=UPI002724E171|nr:hypothetical protein [Haliea sp. E1-2-M8]MDO8863992.1 hypothetical protein [Haliea sp. E1-2-M8]